MFEKYKNKYNGQRCFIIGSGPSLLQENLSLIKNEKIFVVNRSYKALEQGLPHYNFYVCVDKNVYERNCNEIQKLSKFPRFYNHTFLDSESYWKGPRERFIPIFRHENKNSILYKSLVFNIMPTHYYDGWGNTSTAVLDTALIAFFLGFKEIYFLGVDMSYKTNTETHFYGKDYFSTNQPYDKIDRPIEFKSETLDMVVKNLNNFFNKNDVKMVNLSLGYTQDNLFIKSKLSEIFKK